MEAEAGLLTADAMCLRMEIQMPDYQRLSVNINAESAEILRQVTAERQISTTEAIRRAIGLLGFFEEARKDRTKVYTEDQEGHRERVQLV
jgi:hypothetical protein